MSNPRHYQDVESQRVTLLNIEGNEQSQLQGSNLESSTWLSQDDRWWIRVPAQSALVLRRIIMTPVFVMLFSAVWYFVLLPMLIFRARKG
ncbi:hypothetical protein BJX64DRAFT_264941 [Aspergillus heterothallicus]